MEESKGLFGDIPKDDLTVICDDCFQAFFNIQNDEEKHGN